MKVTLDGRELPATKNLAEAINAAVSAARSAGRVVVEVYADGRHLTGDELSKPESFAGVGELRLVSAEPRTLVSESLYDTRDLLDRARSSQETAAAALQVGDMKAAMENLQAAFDVWQVVLTAITNAAQLLGIDLDGVECREAGPTGVRVETVKVKAQGLVEKLGAIKESFNSGDTAALADVLAYDMDSQVTSWQGLLHALAEQARAMPPIAPSDTGGA